MRIHRSTFIIAACGVALAPVAWTQAPKAGLYEVTTEMTWQQSPFPDGMQAPPGSVGPHSSQTCMTKAQIEKYNGPKPEAHGGCEISKIQKHDGGVSAVITCGPPMTGQGTVETKWTDSGHSKSKIHFTGSMHMGPNTKTVEWTINSESVFKSPDCGSVKPAAE